MKDKKFWFGTLMTVGWVGYLIYMISTKGLPTELNAQGDVFAGFFAPLAFLWLVLGYLQQGEELRQSSEALRLQAEELKNSVEQQSQLVEVSRRQLEQEASAIWQERQLREDAARPIFALSHEGYSGSLALFQIKLVLRNDGGTALRTVVELDQPEGRKTIVNKVNIKTDGRHTFDVQAKGNGHYAGEIRWSDTFGNRGTALFRLRMDGHELHITQPISPETGE